jgi:hypothetical protein
MIDYNAELLIFIRNYQNYQNEKEFESVFNKIKRFFKLQQYHDPSGVLTIEDIEVIAMIGFWKAINKYDEIKWDNAIGWCYYIVRQQILREIKGIYKGNKNYINSYMNPNLNIEQLGDNIVEEEAISTKIDVSICYISDIQELCSRYEDINITASKVFQLKLAFPELSRNSIAKILGFKRRNGLAKIVKQIRKIAFDHLNKELQDGRLRDPFEEFISSL